MDRKVDRSEDPRVGRWEDQTVDRMEDRSEGPKVGRWGDRRWAARGDRRVDRTADRSEDRMVGLRVGQSEELRAETVGASEGPVGALDSFRVRVRIQPMVQAC